MPFELHPDGTIQQWVGIFDEVNRLYTSSPGRLFRPSDPDYERAFVWLTSEDEALARVHLAAYRRGLGGWRDR